MISYITTNTKTQKTIEKQNNKKTEQTKKIKSKN